MKQDESARLIRIACRALGRHRLAHAYGHCSIKLSEDRLLVSPAKPLGMVEPDDDCLIVPINGPFPDGVLGEVRIHREIYKRRGDVRAIVRCQPPKTMSLSAMERTPRPRHGFGAYFWPSPPLWNNPQLLRDDDRATQLAQQLGAAKAIIMRGNGLVTCGGDLAEAVVLSWYLEDAARVELDILAAGIDADNHVLSEADCQGRAVYSGQIIERMWSYLTDHDPEGI